MVAYRSITQAPNDLAALANALKAAGRGDLRRELLSGIRQAGGPTVTQVQAAARQRIPSSGGLADLVASNVNIRSRLAGSSASVRVRRKGRYPTDRTMVGIDATGTWRHPVRGNRRIWVTQSAPGAIGWFTKTIDRNVPQFRKAILRAMEDVAGKIRRAV